MMKKLKLLSKVLKSTGIKKIIIAFIIFYFFCSFILIFTEPTIKTYAEALWYGFSVLSTSGFGDFVATNLTSRVISILLGVFGMFVTALLPGVVVNFYSEILKSRSDEQLSDLLDKLEVLPELSKEELQNIANKVKKIRNSNNSSD